LLLLLPALLAVVAVGQDPAPPPADAEQAQPEPVARVIIRVNRALEVPGHVQLEDDNVIVLRKPGGEVISFAKGRIIRIVRLVDPEPDQRGRVRLRNGQTTTGIIVEDSFERVVVDVEGIPISFKRADVDDVTLEPTFEQRYTRFRDSIEPRQHARRLALAAWLVEEHKYKLAETELETLIRDNPELPEARQMLLLVRAQIALDDAQGNPTKPKATVNPPPPPAIRAGPVYDHDILPDELLDHDDVNLIRVYEIDFAVPPKVSIDPETIRTLLEKYGADPRMPRGADARTALFRADPLKIVELMFELRARDLYARVRVASEPRALNAFRQRVHNAWLMTGCANSRCHGGPDAGRFFLYSRNYKDARVRYTNLMILENLEIDPEWPLVNYTSPADSLIIQYGLPREVARKPHPNVRGWKAVFTKANQPLLRQTIDWIGGMMKPRPKYPIDFEPPVLVPPASEDDPEGALEPTKPRVDR
jgi:hypothetical protein